jgi:predicted acetyltransferase
MSTTPRPLLAADIPALLALGQEAFGAYPAGYTPPGPDEYPQSGRHNWGSFEGDRLVAKVLGREYHSWFHGSAIATNGIAGVAVTAEARGRGLLDDLFAAVLDEGLRERGEVLSTLFPTAPGIYRRFGYELIGSYDTVEVPTARLAEVPAPTGITLRRAEAADFDEVRRVYDAWAAGQNGPLSRRGASFPANAEEFVAAYSGVTLAADDSGVVGYASWHRGTGYDARATIEVSDLLALTADGHRALWRLLGSFSSVTGRVRLQTSGDDVARLVLPFADWPVVERHPYMLRVHDVAGALTGHRLATPGTAPADVGFSVAGDLLGTMNGDWVLSSEAGLSACVPGPAVEGGPVFAPRGLALVYAGTQACADVRAAGLLAGGDPETDRVLDSLFGGRRVHIRDYF